MREVQLPQDSDPLVWWQEQDTFRLLWPLARMILGIPAANTSAERLFSSAGFLATDRDSLEVSTLEDLAIVRHFMVTSSPGERDALIQRMTAAFDAVELPLVAD